jgi:hypothetical protein
VRRRRHGRGRSVRGRLIHARTLSLSVLLVIAAGCQFGNGGGGGGGGSSFGGGAPPPQSSAASTGNPIVGVLNAKHPDAGKHEDDEDAGVTRARDAGPSRAH